jgi:hypothetical protein
MEAITVAAGVSNVTRYRHAKSKDDLFGVARATITVGGSRKQSCLRLPRACCDFVQLRRAATPHMTTKPELPYGAPPGPVMYPSLASFKMRNSSFTRPR